MRVSLARVGDIEAVSQAPSEEGHTAVGIRFYSQRRAGTSAAGSHQRPDQGLSTGSIHWCVGGGGKTLDGAGRVDPLLAICLDPMGGGARLAQPCTETTTTLGRGSGSVAKKSPTQPGAAGPADTSAVTEPTRLNPDAQSTKSKTKKKKKKKEKEEESEKKKKATPPPIPTADGFTKCSFCDKVFARGQPIESHLNAVHPHRCGQCFEAFRSARSLEAHREAVHGVTNPVSDTPTAKKKTNQCSCPHCEQTFRNSEKLNRHRARVHDAAAAGAAQVSQGVLCPECGAPFPTRTARTRHRREAHGKGYACGKCEVGLGHCVDALGPSAYGKCPAHTGSRAGVKREFPSSAALKQHRSDAHRVACTHGCGTFKSEQALQRHVHTKHAGGGTAAGTADGPVAPTQWTCQVCGEALSGRKALNKHKMSAHPKAKKGAHGPVAE